MFRLLALVRPWTFIEVFMLGALVALAVAVFLSVWLQVEPVPLEMWTRVEAPGAMFP